MTKDEELKEAAEFWDKSYRGRPEDYPTTEEVMVAYHRHKLDTAWVSVKERLPKVSQQINIFTEKYGVEGFIVDADKDIRFLLNDCKMTHWQPLPEPPKETK